MPTREKDTRTEAERETSLQEHMKAFAVARVAFNQGQIDTQLALLHKKSPTEISPNDQLVALGKLLNEFDRTDGSDYHIQFSITKEAYERLTREQRSLVMREEISDGTTHYFMETKGTNGETVMVGGRPKPTFEFHFTRIVQHGVGFYSGELGIEEISEARIVGGPQAVTKAATTPPIN